MPVSMKKKWVIAPPIPEQVIQELRDYPPLLRQLLYNRGITDAASARDFMDAAPSRYDPFLLCDMEVAVERLLQAVDRQEKIAVYGDYDVDGVTSTVLLVQVLRRLGANVREYIPNRFDEGYGLNREAISHLAEMGVRLVVTVDCGIRSPEEVEHAHSLGVDVIISDHHHPQETLPAALAVVCHRRPDNTYPDTNLAGVGLAYKIAQALLSRRPVPGVEAEDWLDLVALGTVADLVPLTGENRKLVRAGLNRMRLGYRQGLVSLAQAAGVSLPRVTANEIAYYLGPRLNAAGRLESALAAFELLNSDDVFQTGMLAQRLDDQNRERQKLTLQTQVQAEALARETGLENLLFAVHPNFNSGIVGLAASKLVETHYRPAVVGQMGEEFTRASCRSIPEFHITEALDACRDLLVRHGGHAMAAGFTVRNENLPELIRCLREITNQALGERDLCPTIRADAELRLSEPMASLMPMLDLLQPFGQGNPEPQFISRDLRIIRAKPVGSEGQHLRLTVADKHVFFDAIAFRQGEWASRLPERVDLVYQFERNVWNGRETLQLNVKDIKPAGEPD